MRPSQRNARVGVPVAAERQSWCAHRNGALELGHPSQRNARVGVPVAAEH